jgi:hypothetical protein
MSHTSQAQNNGKLIHHYILICWHDGDPAVGWRFSLVNPREERRPFPDLAALMSFLSGIAHPI